MSRCKFCGKEFPAKSIGGHIARCKMNPNYSKTTSIDRENLKKGIQTSKDNAAKNKKEFKQICPKCGKEFIVIGTQREFDKGKLRKFCSRACANTRVHSEETKQKTSQSISKYYETHEYPEGFYEPIKIYYCKQCGKPFTMKDDRDTNGRKYCSSKCRKKWLRANCYPKTGGYRERSGRSKSGCIKEYTVQVRGNWLF